MGKAAALFTVVISAESLTLTFPKIPVLLAGFITDEARHFLADSHNDFVGAITTPSGRTLKLTSGGFVFLQVNLFLRAFNPLPTLELQRVIQTANYLWYIWNLNNFTSHSYFFPYFNFNN